MGRISSTLLATALWLASSIMPATAQTFPVRSDRYVNDYADLLTPAQEQAIAAKLADLRKNRDIEMTVLTIESRADYGQTVTNEAFATSLFNQWGLGDSNSNDGVLFLVSRLDREMRIEVGSGYGSTKDAPLKKIIDRIIIPEFRLNTYDTGIINGVDHTIREIAGVWPDQYDANPLVRWWTDLRVWTGGFVIAIFAPIGWLIWRAFHAAKRRAPRRCPVDGSWMPRVLHEFEHKHLTKGQQKEEELHSVAYDVWICRECEHVTIKGKKRWITSQKLCKSCGFHTLESDGTEIIRDASPTGLDATRTSFRCNNCKEKSSKISYHFEREARSNRGAGRISSSPRSGRRGGGRSSGGGASGRW